MSNRIACGLSIHSPAWLKGRLWLLADPVAYEVEPQLALAKDKVEPPLLRRFETPCVRLASDGTNLWGVGPSRRTLHRLYVP